MTNFKDKIFTFHYVNGKIVRVFNGNLGEYVADCAAEDREELVLKNRATSGKFIRPVWENYSNREICDASAVTGSAEFDPACNIACAMPVKWFELKEYLAFVDSTCCESFAEGLEAFAYANFGEDILGAMRSLLCRFRNWLRLNPGLLVDFVEDCRKWDLEEELKDAVLEVVCGGDREEFEDLFSNLF